MRDTTVVYFGRRWDAPHFDDAGPISTPVGWVCGLCPELIDKGDDGTMMPFGDRDIHGFPIAVVKALHLECWLRLVRGSPAHVAGQCSCTGRAEPAEDRSWREQGREVIRLIGKGAWLNG